MAALIPFQFMHFTKSRSLVASCPSPSHLPRWVLVLQCSRSSSLRSFASCMSTCHYLLPPSLLFRVLFSSFPYHLGFCPSPMLGCQLLTQRYRLGPCLPCHLRVRSCQSFLCDPHPVPTHLSCNCSTAPIHRRGQCSPVAPGPSWSCEQNPQVIQFITCMSLALSGTLWAQVCMGQHALDW